MSTGVKIGLLALALIAVWWLAMSPVPPPQEPAAVSGRGAMPIRAVAPVAGQAAIAHAEPAEEPSPAATAQAPSAATQDAPSARDDRGTSTPHATAPMRQGPVEELAKRFAGESRGATSDADDKRVREAFTDPTIPPALLHSAECRRSVCRVELRWSTQTDVGYVLGLTRAVGSFSAALGIEGAGEPDAEGVRPLVVYFSHSAQ
jgi:hypothetical protein